MLRGNSRELIEYQYRALPTREYEIWIEDYIKSLSPKEVKQLSLGMPALIPSGLLVPEISARLSV